MSRQRRRSKNRRKTKRVKAARPVAPATAATHAGRNKLVGIALIIMAIIGIGWIAGNESPGKGGPASVATPAQPVALDVTPQKVIQGDPVMITLDNVASLSDVKSGSVGASPLLFTMYQGVPTAFYAAGINSKTGTSTVMVVLNNGTKLSQAFFVGARIRPTESLPVPDQIGGNSPANQVVVADTLDTENAEIAAVPSYKKGAFWTGPFAYPLAAPDGAEGLLKITDPYGFNRDSGEITIPHMGVDFKAASGTPVYAINDGVVRLTKTFVVYGNTVIVDHGVGIESLYMHLSRIVATPGEVVKKGELLGYSGETGYAVGPHLHLSVKINGISIDPLKFFALFGLNGTD